MRIAAVVVIVTDLCLKLVPETPVVAAVVVVVVVAVAAAVVPVTFAGSAGGT